jgi:hypothetical protein
VSHFIVRSAGLNAVQGEDGLHDGGGSAWAAAELRQDLPGLEDGDCAFAAARIFAWVLFTACCLRDSLRSVAVALERRVRIAPLAPVVALVRERHHAGGAQRVDDAVSASGGQVVCRAWQRW